MITDLKSRTKKIFIILLCLGIFIRFYNLSWGSPYFFHPDERNIATAVNQLEYPEQLNPHFFAYGTLPIYSIYFLGVASNFIKNLLYHTSIQPTVVAFEDAIIISRLFSFFLSVAILRLIYVVGKKVGGQKTATMSLVLSLFSVGLIQYAHFGTFEMWLTFFTLLLCYVLLRYVETLRNSYIIFGSIILGFLFSIKISSLIYLPLCLFVVVYSQIGKIRKEKSKFLLIEKIILKLFFICGISFITLYLTSPFYWFDNVSFLNSINYESSVAFGKYSVFYTQHFIQSKPIIFQFLHIYPFLLNPFVTFSVLIALPFIVKNILYSTKNQNMLLVLLFLLLSFFSQSFLFVKWARYYIPTLPFIYIFIAKGLELFEKSNKEKYASFITTALIFISIFYSLSYFKVVLVDKDTRLDALSWARKNIKSDAKILTEPFDLGITPFNPYFSAIKIFNFYQLDESKEARQRLEEELKSTKFIILPSHRIVQSRLYDHQLFPKSSQFYKKLFQDEKSFTKVYETKCDILCMILYSGNPVFAYEQTVNVFDRPEVFIFEKIKK